jgi:ribosome production factor 1
MSPTKGKHNRLRLFHLRKKTKSQQKLQKRLAQAKKEKSDLAAKQVSSGIVFREPIKHNIFQKQRLARNVPRTLDNTREPDPSTEIHRLIDPCLSEPPLGESAADADSDPISSLLMPTSDPCISPKLLVTTSPKATKATYDFCTELVGVFPGAEFVPRKQRKEFQIGRIAGWASGRGYKHLCIVNEDMKQPSKQLRCQKS